MPPLKQQETAAQAEPPKYSIVRAEHPLWLLPFRPNFLLAASYAVLSILLWSLYLNGVAGVLTFTKLWPTLWHVHEMIFAFGGLCAMGFLLTAVQNWTGLRSLNGPYLALLTATWIVARLCFWLELAIPAIVLQGAWWLACIAVFLNRVIQNQSRRNYQFIPLLILIMSLDLGTMALGFVGDNALALHLGRSGILLFVILITIVGGRIIPLFTRNATQSNRIRSVKPLEIAVLATSLVSALLYLSHYFLTDNATIKAVLAATLVTAGLLHGLRLSMWDSAATLSNAMLWSMHLSYLMMAAGLIVLGLSYWIAELLFADALHLIAIGAMGGMILTVMTRVSLGHTGRPIQAGWAMACAFLLVAVAALVRALMPALGWVHEAWNLSAMLWVVAFGLFVMRLAPILTRPRH